MNRVPFRETLNPTPASCMRISAAKRWAWRKNWAKKGSICRTMSLTVKKLIWLQKEQWAEKEMMPDSCRKVTKTKDAAMKRIEVEIKNGKGTEKTKKVEAEREAKVGGEAAAGKVKTKRKETIKAAVATEKAVVVTEKAVKAERGKKVEILRDKGMEKEAVARAEAEEESRTKKVAGIRNEETELLVGIRREVRRGKDVGKRRVEVKEVRVAIGRSRLKARKKGLKVERKVDVRQMVESLKEKRKIVVASQVRRNEEGLLRVAESQVGKERVVVGRPKLKRA